MKRKERKQLAQKIANAQRKYDKSTDMKEKSRLEAEIMELCSQVESMEDMIAVDEMVMELLS